jgi:hypothetical protein
LVRTSRVIPSNSQSVLTVDCGSLYPKRNAFRLPLTRQRSARTDLDNLTSSSLATAAHWSVCILFLLLVSS